MSESFSIKVSGDALQVMERIKDRAGLMHALAGAVDKQNQFSVGRIVQDRMNGVGPFPPEQHRLGFRTGLLKGSLHASAAQVSGDGIRSAIGSNVRYAAIHEFGGVIHHPRRVGFVRLRTDAKGNQLRRGNLAIFASRAHKRFESVRSHAGAYDVTMP